MSMKLLDKDGLAYFWGKIKSYVAGLLSSKADDSDVVHKAGDEDITGTKTFVGSKKVAFKQSAANDKLGFTLFSSSNVEQGYLEYNPTNKISGVPLMTLGNYATATAGRAYVGFRRYSSISGANGAYNLLTPLISDAKAPFNLTTTYTNFFLPLGVTDGTTTVVTDKSGLLDISSLLPAIPSLSCTIAGSGNAVTDISVSGHAITATKGETYVTSSGSITGNAGTATKFASAQSVALTGDVTGSASSQAGWSIATTLANSGVTVGRYTSVSVDAKGRVTAGNVKHSYTTAANAAKNWYRIANANTSQIDTSKPLHLQFFVRAQAQAAGVAYWQSWFVDLEVWGQYCGARIFGNTNAPFSQIRVLYENTATSVTSSTRPAVDIYLNYVLTGGSVIEIEEVYNSGFEFVADGVLAVSTVPSGYESRAVQAYSAGVNNCGTADFATYHYLYGYNISTNTTLSTSNSNHRYRILNCTGTITLTVPSWNSSSGWFFIKNNGTGVVTLHPASTSVMFDNVSANITLQPGEFIRLACQSNNHYSIVDDGRWKSQKADKATTLAGYGITDAKIANGTITLGSNSITPLTSVPSHNQASNTVNAMTGYAKAESYTAIAASDSLNTAIGKLEAGLGGSSSEVTVGTGLVNDNGTIRLALLHRTSYNDGQIIVILDSQYDTPYSYDDDEDTYEYNPTPYVIDLSQSEYKFNSVALGISKFMMTQAQVDALKPYLKSVFAKVYWKSGTITDFTHVPSSSAWASNGFAFDFTIPSRSTDYPSEEIFDTIERIELVMTKSTNTYHPYGFDIGTFFPAGSYIMRNGTYFA